LAAEIGFRPAIFYQQQRSEFSFVPSNDRVEFTQRPFQAIN
jgi:hypothetical protein